MRWEKPSEGQENRSVAKRWPWAYPTYEVVINKPLSDISRITIDESGLMADVNRSNNVYNTEAERVN
jgi:hypothetical protein